MKVLALQINCFDVLSDTTTKTEISLRERVTSAISCSPCLIVLRHADVLSRSPTAADSREGLNYYLCTSSFIFTPYILGPSTFGMAQQYINEANKTQRQECILLGIVEHGKIPEGVSFSNEIEIKVRTQLYIPLLSHI